MKKTGAFLAIYALEQIGVRYTFGIPGVHNTELYDELGKSTQIHPILVTHEGSGAFMADAVSRVSDSIGTLVIVPAAGTTHAMSGIAEAFLDGIPMLIISGGVRRDTGRHYQLHQIDQGRLLDGIIKKFYRLEKHRDVIPAIYEAYLAAITGEPGPVFVEIPVELQLFQGEIDVLTPFGQQAPPGTLDKILLNTAVDLLTSAGKPAIFVGWGAVDASQETIELAQLLNAPVATTLQGKSAFPARHPLHTGVGFGPSAVPAAENAFSGIDCLLAIGVRFSELATGSYGITVPENLIHVDINPEVFNRNYPAKVAIEGDARNVLSRIVQELKASNFEPAAENPDRNIERDKLNYLQEWKVKPNPYLVSPGLFFQTLKDKVDDRAIMVVDDGKHTFLASELFAVDHPRHFISPTDFNCMGYCVPAAIGAKLGNPDKQVVGIVGDGAFMMTGMELIMAVTHGLGIMIFVFHDGELGQISQFQKIPLNRKTATIIGDLNVAGVAQATGAEFLSMENDSHINEIIAQTITFSEQGQPVVVDVKIDYSKKTRMTKGVVKTNLARFPLIEKIRFISRAMKRHVLG